MTRVCCFCESWESGGIESFLTNVITRLDPTEFEIDIVASKLGSSVFTAPLETKGIRFIELSGTQHNILKNAKPFKQLLAERSYDVVHLNVFQGLSLYYAKLARRAGVPKVIAHSHGMGLRNSGAKQLKLMLHNLGKSLWKSCVTDYWACSKPAARFLFGDNVLQHPKFTTVPNGIETERFRFDKNVRERIRAELGISNELLVGTVGRLSSEKNQTFLLDVFAALSKKNPNTRLILVGDGDDREALEGKVARLGIADSTIFYGTTTHVEDLLCAMDVFVLPSLMEGLGIAAIEAQASGLPALCSDCIPDETRITFRLNAVPLEAGADAWANTILRIRESHSSRESGADEVAEADFDIEDVARRIGSMYREQKNELSENLSYYTGL